MPYLDFIMTIDEILRASVDITSQGPNKSHLQVRGATQISGRLDPLDYNVSSTIDSLSRIS